MRTDCFWTAAIALLACMVAGTACATWSHNSLENNAVCVLAGEQLNTMSVSDGEGGVIAVWEDERSGDLDLYAQKMDAWGNAAWPAGGVAICGAPDDQDAMMIVSDGAGGAIVVWRDFRSGTDYDVYAQRVDASGALLWGTGVEVAAADGDQDSAVLTGDGTGGAIIAWEDHRSDVGGGDVYAQRINAGGAMAWTDAVVVASDTLGTRHSVAMASDGFGGAIIAWVDEGVLAARLDDAGAEVWRSDGYIAGSSGGHPRVLGDGFGGAIIACEDLSVPGDANVVAQRVDSFGTLLWGTSGVTVCGSAGDQEWPQLVSDGAAGAIFTWADASTNIYVQRVSGLGVPLWAGGGLPIAVAVANASVPRIVEDGAGGAVVTWHGGLADNEDVYAQRIDGSGLALWTSLGETVSNAYGYQEEPSAVGDGAGGVIAVWHDFRNGADSDIYAQRVERNGFLGYPAPVITSVVDRPDDQGGEIIVSWEPSYLDVWPRDEVDDYIVWRRYGGTTRSQPNLPLDACLVNSWDPQALERYGWAVVGQVQAFQLSEYAYVVPTFGDSSEAGVVQTDVMVLAHSYMIDDCWMSEPDFGYSIDNWAPGPPDSLSAAMIGPDVELTWSPSGYRDDDLSHYVVFRSEYQGFTPSGTTLIGTTPDTVYVDIGPDEGTWFYRVLAEDVHGNESMPSGEASVAVVGSGVDGPELSTVATIRGNAPNPFNPATDITVDLPAGVDVRLSVYDLDGRRVATLVNAVMGPGRYAVAWSGRDDRGREMPSGVYFARLEAGKDTAVHKMVLLK